MERASPDKQRLLLSSRNVTPAWLRVGLLLFGLILAAQAIWIISAEYYHSRRLGLSVGEWAALTTGLDRENTNRAASLAVVRGDLWAESAFTYSDLLWKEPAPGLGREVDDSSGSDARMRLERALVYSPYRGDVWLMFAAMAARYNWPNYQPSSLLKMSYYTAPNELSLFPLRFRVLLRPDGLQDLEIQDMIRRDIHMVITKTPALRPAFASIYGAAPTQSKAFADRIVSEIDPAYLAAIRGELR